MKSHVWSNSSKYSSTELKSVFFRICFNIVKCMGKKPLHIHKDATEPNT